jgi:hypothetical protein
MSFQWLEMRIAEEQDRRRRESEILERLPRALEELHGALTGCIESFTSTFGAEAAEMTLQTSKVLVSVREQQDGKWEQSAKVVVSAIPSVPGFQIERGGDPPVVIEVGMLPGDKVFYRDREQDKYVSMEELTRRVLDRALFPKLGE